MTTCPLCRGEGECNEAILKLEDRAITEEEFWLRVVALLVVGFVVLVGSITGYNVYVASLPHYETPGAVERCATACGQGRLGTFVAEHEEMVGDGHGGAQRVTVPSSCTCVGH